LRMNVLQHSALCKVKASRSPVNRHPNLADLLPGKMLHSAGRHLDAPCHYQCLSEGTPVANIKSQIKRNRQNERRRERNKAVRTELKTAAKKARTAVSEDGGEAATELLRSASRAIDKAASRGIVHKRAAARRKSRLAKAAGNAAPSPEG
jgi:small subunit ribosomal protein S20